MKKIGIYGGTFDPPHLGHRNAARAALESLGLDELIFVPASTPPHKILPEEAATAEQRLEMTRLMADGMGDPRVHASDLEVRRGGTSYTAQSLRQLRQEHPEDILYLLMGTDMFLSFQTWKECQAICDLVTLAPFARSESDDLALFQRHGEELRAAYGARVMPVELPRVTNISSTELRSALGRGGGQSYLWTPVYGYILRQRLYHTDTDLKDLTIDQLRAVSFSMVRAQRLPHILGVEQEAVCLARRWGWDEDAARRAGILHDCTKYLDYDSQLNLCREYDIVLDDMERNTAKLLHAKTGAALARHWFGQSEEVCSAICWHTTGRPGMTLGEKILYMADYIEPNRDFPEVSAMRKMAYQDLDEAMRMGLALSIQEVAEKHGSVHENTQKAYAYLKGE